MSLKIRLKFEDLKITTMTMIFFLEGHIDIPSIHHLLTVKIMDNINTNITYPAKYKLPKSDIPGSIISMNYSGIKRGIIRNKKNHFKNSINIDLSTEIKNINLKLSPMKIQLCGAVSRENGLEAVTHLINQIKDIKLYINYMKQNPEQYDKIVTWVSNDFKQSMIKKKIILEKINYKSLIFNIVSYFDDYTIKNNVSVPNDIDKEVGNYIIALSKDLIYHSDFVNKIRNILKFNSVYDTDINVTSYNEVMVNFNYNLGFNVNRDILNALIDGKNGFLSNYDNALVNNVTIELPYDNPEETEIVTKRKSKQKIPHHTFLVYRSGAVTQSGPNNPMIKHAFELFISTLEELGNDIKLTDQ
jgi:hypothetical protein